MFPFGRNKNQQIFSVVLIIIGIFLILSTAPFIIKLASIQFYSTSLGVGLFITGIIYLLEAQL